MIFPGNFGLLTPPLAPVGGLQRPRRVKHAPRKALQRPRQVKHTPVGALQRARRVKHTPRKALQRPRTVERTRRQVERKRRQVARTPRKTLQRTREVKHTLRRVPQHHQQHQIPKRPQNTLLPLGEGSGMRAWRDQLLLELMARDEFASRELISRILYLIRFLC